MTLETRQLQAKCRAAGFTLIELLVVIAIIALLISILLPALSEVRRQGKIIVCRSNMRQVVIAFTTYGNDYKDAIPGSPTTSGYRAVKDKVFNGVSMQSYDWMGPLASQLGYNDMTDSGTEDEASRAERFRFYRDAMKVGICTENNILAVPYPNAKAPWTAGRMLSYNVSTQFSSTEQDAPWGTNNRINSGIDRRAYKPFFYRMGTPHMKAMVYEGSRYAEWDESTSSQPDFDFKIDADFGGAFGDTGPWFSANRSLVRSIAPGEGASQWVTSKFDPRRYAFRHGSKQTNTSSSTQILGHLAFLDGHVEIMDDIKATNPDYWFPTNTIIGSNNKGLDTWSATKKAFPDKVGGSGKKYVVP